MVVTATFRMAEHGRFTVSGCARRDLTGTTFKVGWWDLTTGKGTEPVTDLQSITVSGADDAAGSGAPPAEDAELRDLIVVLEAGDLVTAHFDFEGCGPFMVSGGIRRDQSGTRWILAGHHLALGDAPASRLRHLVIDRKATVLAATGDRYDLFGA